MIVKVSAIRSYFMSIRMGDWIVAPEDRKGILEINDLTNEPKPTGFYAFGMSYILGDSPKIKIQDHCYPLNEGNNVLEITLIDPDNSSDYSITITITSNQKTPSIKTITPSENLKKIELSKGTESIIYDINPETLKKEFTDLGKLENFLEDILSTVQGIKVDERIVIPKIVELNGTTIFGDEKNQGGGASSEQQGGAPEINWRQLLTLGVALIFTGAFAYAIREKRKEYIHSYLREINQQRKRLIGNINTKIEGIKKNVQSSKIYFIIDTKRDNQDDYNKKLVKEYFVAETEILDEQKKCPVLFLIGTSDMCHQIKDTFDDNIPISVLDILGNNDIEIKNYFHDRKKKNLSNMSSINVTRGKE